MAAAAVRHGEPASLTGRISPFQGPLGPLEERLASAAYRLTDLASWAAQALRQDSSDCGAQVQASLPELEARFAEVETLCLEHLSGSQPGPRESVVAALRMLGHLRAIARRLHDLARGIQENRVILPDSAPHLTQALTGEVCGMLTRAVLASLEGDAPLAEAVIHQDTWVDRRARDRFRSLLRDLRQHPTRLEDARMGLSSLHHWEEMADHAVALSRDTLRHMARLGTTSAPPSCSGI